MYTHVRTYMPRKYGPYMGGGRKSIPPTSSANIKHASLRRGIFGVGSDGESFWRRRWGV